jgi:hypothetical protein
MTELLVPARAAGDKAGSPFALAAARAEAVSILARGSKSFAIAGKLLPAACRDDAAVVYAWCRRADDAVDMVDAGAPSPVRPPGGLFLAA